MTARAIWQGALTIQKHRIGVKLFSAVLDRQIHFHLLHKKDLTRVLQKMVDPETGTNVPFDQSRKAFEVGPGLFIPLTREELDRSVPESSREVEVVRFVPLRSIDLQLFDRPYYLGPAGDSSTDYFALAQALDRKQNAGIVAWVMRKHSYVGALVSQQGYLMLITLRHFDEVVASDELEAPQGRPLDAKEKSMAEKLVEALSGDFDPSTYSEEYQARVRELIEAKRKGKRIKRKPSSRRRPEGSLADALAASLKQLGSSGRA